MRCFVHAAEQAVAICKSCNRGICHECVAEFPDGVACRGRCEGAVQAINSLITKNTSLASTASHPSYMNALLLLGMGLVSLYFGLTDFGDRRLNLLTVFGAVSVAGGVTYYLRAQKIRRS